MAEKKDNLKLENIRSEARRTLKLFADKLTEQLSDNLQSITVVGSSVTEDFNPQKSDINTVLILGKRDLSSLNKLAGMARDMKKKRISAPLLMTSEYIERSRDVFGIELLDFQLTHETIFGEDPFASLSFTKSDVRLQCERELKATLIRLRQGYIASAANKKLVRDILISTAISLVPLLRAMLWLKDIGRSNRAKQIFKKAADEFSIIPGILHEVFGWRHQKIRLTNSEMQDAFEAIYTTIEQLALIVDKLEV